MTLKEDLYALATDQGPNGRIFLEPMACILSGAYGLGVSLARRGYDWHILKTHRFSCPVISVGNITWGGTGKTPLVEWIARYLAQEKSRPVILTRGYMGHGRPESKSDEAGQLEAALGSIPVMVGRNRIRSAAQAIRDYSPDVLLLDDGFQHWRLFRDLDIVVVDSTNPFGNGHLIPRGILRERIEALERADIFVLTKTDGGQSHLPILREKLSRLNPQAPIAESIHAPVELIDLKTEKRLSLSFLKGKRITAFCGIGDPKSFERILKQFNIQLENFRIFPDHHRYSAEDIGTLSEDGQKHDGIFVTTQKDAIKLKKFQSQWREHAWFSLVIEIRFTHGKDDLLKRITHLLVR